MGRKRILGRTVDFITGREITDTDDERYRQKIARLLVEEKGYSKGEIQAKRGLRMVIDGKTVHSMVDFVIRINGKSYMVIRYGPGSLVTRERPALSVARILEEYQIPVTVVTNGEDAEILDTASGKIITTGIASIPARNTLVDQFKDVPFQYLSKKQIEAEKRILSAYDFVEHSLECDDDWCETG